MKDLLGKAVRYAAVSAFGVILTQALLLVLHAAAGVPGTTANAIAVIAASGPAYLLNRQWVWRRSGGHDLTREVLPFWGFALVGLALSTVLVSVAGHMSHSAVAANGANMGAFGALWVVRFFVLDQVLSAPIPVTATA